tara:strand:+ start:4007 stop:4357 length:351 start_codon:yes stop_codon:yes gene_type:complete
MAIPSGSGTEVLKRAVFTAQNNTTVTLLTVPTDHIVTILNILIINRTSETGKYCNITTIPSGGAFTYLMNGGTNLPADSTFVFNEKVVLHPGDVLKVGANPSGFDVWLSYLDQDWS